MDIHHLMQVFVTVVEQGGFSAAARRLQISPPAVTRAVSALEDTLKVALLTRTTRIVRPTDAGLRYFEDAKLILAAIEEAGASAAGINAAPSGILSVTAPVEFGRLFVMPVINAYLAQHAGVSANCLFVDRVVNFVDEGMDVGVRIGALPDSSLKAIKVGEVRRVVCATPQYLQQHGQPATPHELQAHAVISAAGLTPSQAWTFTRSQQVTHITLHPRISTNTIASALQAVAQGHGIGRFLSYQVEDLLQAGVLVELLADDEDTRLPIHIIHKQGRHGAAKVRIFVDMLKQSIRAGR